MLDLKIIERKNYLGLADLKVINCEVKQEEKPDTNTGLKYSQVTITFNLSNPEKDVNVSLPVYLRSDAEVKGSENGNYLYVNQHGIFKYMSAEVDVNEQLAKNERDKLFFYSVTTDSKQKGDALFFRKAHRSETMMYHLFKALYDDGSAHLNNLSNGKLQVGLQYRTKEYCFLDKLLKSYDAEGKLVKDSILAKAFKGGETYIQDLKKYIDSQIKKVSDDYAKVKVTETLKVYLLLGVEEKDGKERQKIYENTLSGSCFAFNDTKGIDKLKDTVMKSEGKYSFLQYLQYDGADNIFEFRGTIKDKKEVVKDEEQPF